MKSTKEQSAAAGNDRASDARKSNTTRGLRQAPQKNKSQTTSDPQEKGRTSPRLRKGSKSGKILDLLRQAEGATLAAMMRATGWQPHSIRGFLSTASKKHQVKIESSKKAGQRIYRIAK